MPKQANKQDLYNLLVAYYQGRLDRTVLETFLAYIPPEWIMEALILHINDRKRQGETLPPIPQS